MKPLAKLHLWSAGYCLVLAGLNWSRTVEYARAAGLRRESIDGIGGALLLSGAIALYLAWSCIRTARLRLEAGKKVQSGRWVPSWSVLIYALPLVFRFNSTSNWTDPDGALATATGGYGGALSRAVFLFAVAGLLLFQIRSRLSIENTEAEPAATGNAGTSPVRFDRALRAGVPDLNR